MYLERFSRQGQVFVRRREGNTFTSNCINVAVESGFYDVRAGDGSSSTSKAVEATLSDVEGAVSPAFNEIDRTGAPPPRR